MSAVFQELNLRGQSEILVLHAPESFEPELRALSGVTVRRTVEKIQEITSSLAFATGQEDLDGIAASILPKARGDAVLWFAYSKGTSRTYRCDFNRDTGWGLLGKAGLEGVRQIAIDEDQSALRFRRVEFVRRLTRDPERLLTRPAETKSTPKPRSGRR